MDREFSATNFGVTLGVIVLSVVLTILEMNGLFSQFADGILEKSLASFGASSYFPITKQVIDGLIDLWRKSGFFGKLIGLAFYAVLILITGLFEAALSVIWLLLLLVLLLLAFLTSVIFKYALAPILAIAALGLTANSFSEEHSYFNCGFSVLGSLVCIASTVMYYIYFAR